MFVAHNLEDKKFQTVKEHCCNVSVQTGKNLLPVRLEKCGNLLGIIHDMGKEKRDFQEYIANLDSPRGSVQHAFASSRFLIEHSRKFHVEMLSYVVGAHHGLFDCLDVSGSSGFERICNRDEGYEESVTNYFNDVITKKEFECLLKESELELNRLVNEILKFDRKSFGFYIGMTIRMMLSGLIDADHRDTFEFYKGVNFPVKNIDWNQCVINIENKLDSFSCVTPIDKARSSLSDLCKELETKGSGIYTLNLPTGAGKTLSSLRSSVLHVIRQHKKRILYVVPLLAITKQNFEVICNATGFEDAVLEHDSDITYKKDSDQNLYTEDWSSPIIVTTLVQFLNTLFGHKSSNIRRFHSLADSVIIIDEVQSVPLKMLSLFNLSINFLANFCNATVVLCSATQPHLDSCDIGYPLYMSESIVPYHKELWDVFKRADIETVDLQLENVGNFIVDKLDKNLLCICNTKKEAKVVYLQLLEKHITVYHLSAGMCHAHREEVFNDIKESLRKKERFVCISTQLIEMGVDISFQKVVRFAAGLDNVLQALGRCNRDGLYGKGILYVLFIQNEDLRGLSMIVAMQNALHQLLYLFKHNSSQFDDDLSSEKSIKTYYDILYRNLPYRNFMDYPVVIDKSLIISLVELLGFNQTLRRMYPSYNFKLAQSFKTASEKFSVFDAETFTILVPYGEGKKWIEELFSQKALDNVKYAFCVLNQLKKYTVNLYKPQFERLCSCGAIVSKEVDTTIVYVLNGLYYDNFGVSDIPTGNSNIV